MKDKSLLQNLLEILPVLKGLIAALKIERSGAVREFAARLREYSYYSGDNEVVAVEQIDRIVAEMVGDGI